MANCPSGHIGWCAMPRGFPLIFKFGSKLVVQVLPSIAATVIGGYLLAQLHFNRPAEPPPSAAGTEPTQLSPVTVTAANPAGPPPVEPQRRGPVRAVFSAFSTVVGQAVTVTGETVNWVIDLPGKAISAGERLISPPPPPNRNFSNENG